MMLTEIPEGAGHIGRAKIRALLDPQLVQRADELRKMLDEIVVPARKRGVRFQFSLDGELTREDFEERRERLWREGQADKRHRLEQEWRAAEKAVEHDWALRRSDGRLLGFGHFKEVQPGAPLKAISPSYWPSFERGGLRIADLELGIAEMPGLTVHSLRFLTAAEAAEIEEQQSKSAEVVAISQPIRKQRRRADTASCADLISAELSEAGMTPHALTGYGAQTKFIAAFSSKPEFQCFSPETLKRELRKVLAERWPAAFGKAARGKPGKSASG